MASRRGRKLRKGGNDDGLQTAWNGQVDMMQSMMQMQQMRMMRGFASKPSGGECVVAVPPGEHVRSFEAKVQGDLESQQSRLNVFEDLLSKKLGALEAMLDGVNGDGQEEDQEEEGEDWTGYPAGVAWPGPAARERVSQELHEELSTVRGYVARQMSGKTPTPAATLRAGRASQKGAHILEVRIIGARGLRSADVLGKSDPFCLVGIRGQKGERLRTPVVQNTSEPQWHFSGQVKDVLDGQELVFKVFHHDLLGKRDALGEAGLRSDEYLKTGGTGVRELPLTTAGHGVKAYIQVEVSVVGGFVEDAKPAEAADDDAFEHVEQSVFKAGELQLAQLKQRMQEVEAASRGAQAWGALKAREEALAAAERGWSSPDAPETPAGRAHSGDDANQSKPLMSAIKAAMQALKAREAAVVAAEASARAREENALATEKLMIVREREDAVAAAERKLMLQQAELDVERKRNTVLGAVRVEAAIPAALHSIPSPPAVERTLSPRQLETELGLVTDSEAVSTATAAAARMVQHREAETQTRQREADWELELSRRESDVRRQLRNAEAGARQHSLELQAKWQEMEARQKGIELKAKEGEVLLEARRQQLEADLARRKQDAERLACEVTAAQEKLSVEKERQSLETELEARRRDAERREQVLRDREAQLRQQQSDFDEVESIFPRQIEFDTLQADIKTLAASVTTLAAGLHGVQTAVESPQHRLPTAEGTGRLLEDEDIEEVEFRRWQIWQANQKRAEKTKATSDEDEAPGPGDLAKEEQRLFRMWEDTQRVLAELEAREKDSAAQKEKLAERDFEMQRTRQQQEVAHWQRLETLEQELDRRLEEKWDEKVVELLHQKVAAEDADMAERRKLDARRSPRRAPQELRVGDSVVVVEEIESDTLNPVILETGMVGRVHTISEEDGAACVDFDDLDGMEWVVVEDFWRLQKMGNKAKRNVGPDLSEAEEESNWRRRDEDARFKELEATLAAVKEEAHEVREANRDLLEKQEELYRQHKELLSERFDESRTLDAASDEDEASDEDAPCSTGAEARRQQRAPAVAWIVEAEATPSACSAAPVKSPGMCAAAGQARWERAKQQAAAAATGSRPPKARIKIASTSR
eukprot:TRINITY_DN15543_c0_g1_i8.p1 TRINITY_DN15543_c0_g1~~TRINITY_DN15543_c0_g1_i8.p1  ORF type:complete len:1108 (-),score=304.27 TRINITY_DN15543_c0_g1_i8:505-3828(-)